MIAVATPGFKRADGHAFEARQPRLGDKAIVEVIALVWTAMVKIGVLPFLARCLAKVFMVDAYQISVGQYVY